MNEHNVSFNRNQAFLDQVATAVRAVVSATSNHPGSDCIRYAVIGAGVLRQFGLSAEPVAGSAVWQVGPGIADHISCSPELGGTTYVPKGCEDRGAVFHAWIRVTPPGLEPQLLDLATWQFKHMARELDAADGQTTTVEYCPLFLWVPERLATCLSPADVLHFAQPGLFAYVPKPELAPVLIPQSLQLDLQDLVDIACLTYSLHRSGSHLRIITPDQLSGRPDNRMEGPRLVQASPVLQT